MYESENVIVNSPMSFAGAAQRTWRLTRNDNPWLRWMILIPAALLLLAVWETGVIVWYVGFVLILPVAVCYRLLRRGARKRKAEALRHREMMAALEASTRTALAAPRTDTPTPHR